MRKKIKRSGKKFSRRLSKLSRQATIQGRDHIRRNFFHRFSHISHVRLQILEWCLLVGMIIFFAITQAFWYIRSYASDSFEAGGTFTEATLGKINSLNPLFATTNSEKTFSKLTFATLTEVDFSGHTGLGLANSIKTDPESKNWTVTLRPNLKWSDGTPITANDVIFTTNLIQSKLLNTAFSSNLNNVKVEQISDREVRFTIPASFANFPSALDFPILPAHILKNVAPERLLEHQFNSKPVTSGPFEGIKNAIESSAVTATADLPIDTKITNKEFNRRATALNSGVLAFFNLDSQILRNHSLRQAIRKGVNINNIRQNLNGESRLDFPVTNNQIELKTPDLPELDVATAKTEVDKIKLPKDHNLNIFTVSSGNLPTVANSFAAELKRIGINSKVSVHKPDQEFVLGVLKPRAYDILIYEIDFGAEPDLFPYFHSSQANQMGLNFSNYRNSLVDNLILGARDASDHQAQSVKYQRLLKKWLDDVPAIGIYQTSLSYYSHKNSRIFSEDNRLAYPTDRFNDITSWAVNPKTKNRTP